MIKKCCGNDVAAFAKLSHVTCTYSDRWKYVSGGERFLCRSHILALIFVDLWSQVVWGRLWHRYHRIICANVGKKPARNSDIFHHRLQLVYNLQRLILYHNLIRYLFLEQFLSFRNLILTWSKSRMLKPSVLLLVGSWLSCPRDFLHQKFRQLLSFSEIWHRREV